MPAAENPFTPYREVKVLLQALLESVQAVLGIHLTGLYLDGSLATGNFDQDSDIDFVAVTDDKISDDLFLSLRAMHERLTRLDPVWGIQLEGFYLPQRAVRRYEPSEALYPNIERGRGERLKLVRLDETWDVHRAILRQHGVPLAGPALENLIDPVSPAQLRRTMQAVLSDWSWQILNVPARIDKRGYQSYTVLTLCRILYTLEFGSVVSKRAAANWAHNTLGERWAPLISLAWVGRSHPDLDSSPEEVEETLALIRLAQAIGR